VPLELVRIENCRCVERAELRLDPGQNYVFGPNGAGKTTLLEAIYLLGRGRSFRTRQNKRLLRHGQEALTVYGEAVVGQQRHRLGVRLGKLGLEARLDGSAAGGIAELARVLPVHVIEPNIHQLIEGGPSKRRRFLDWGVFHVEHGFLDGWRRYRRVLSQRNAALKLGRGIEAWEAAFVEAGEAVNAARQRYFERLLPVVAAMGRALTGKPVVLSFRTGWAADLSLREAVRGSSERDRAVGSTQVGPHRADFGVSMDARGVREEASRGQQKLVAAALVLAQVQVFAEERGDAGVLLVDDPAAELDVGAFGRLMTALSGLQAQLVVTGLSPAAVPPAPGFPVFHVEQGEVATVV